MFKSLARMRGLLVAFVALALSAGAVLAGGDGPRPAADNGLAIAEEASGLDVPVAFSEDESESEEETEPEEESELEEESEPEESEELDEDADTHGALVSEAARMETPEAFDGHHGAFVSCVARMNRGHLGPDADLSELVLADLTPDDCDRSDEDEEEEGSTEEAVETTDAGPGASVAAKARGGAKANGGAKGARGLGLGR